MLRRFVLALMLVLLPATALLAASAEPSRGGGDPFVDVAGDTMTGDLDLGPHALVLNGEPLHSPAAGALHFGGEEICFVATCAPPTTFNWSAIVGMPAGFADGDDAIDGGIAAGLSCAACVGLSLLAFDPATQSELDSERNDRQSSDMALEARVATLESTSSNGTATDLSCTQCVELEELAFKAATVKALDTETVARETADAALEARVGGLEARVAALEALAQVAGGKVPEFYVLLDLGMDGQPYGPLPFYGGCRKEGVVFTTTDASGQKMTNVVGIDTVPCRIGVGPGMEPSFFAWIDDAMQGSNSTVDIELIPLTGNGNATEGLLLDDARITRVELPRLAPTQAGWIEVELDPSAITKTAVKPCCPNAVPVDPVTGFKFSRVSGAALDLLGLGPLTLSTVTFFPEPDWSTLPLRANATNATTMAELETWLQDTLGSGVEHDVELQLDAADGSNLRLQLFNLGLFRRADILMNADGGIGFEAYVERGEVL